MQNHAYVERLVNLLDPAGNVIFNMSVEDAIDRVGSGDAARVREIDGQFALMHRNGMTITPRGTTIIEEGDRLTIIGQPQGIARLRERYASEHEGGTEGGLS